MLPIKLQHAALGHISSYRNGNIPTHQVIVVVGTPEVRTAAGTEVGFVTFGLMDPLPVEVPPEVDVERAQAAALV